MKKIIISGLVFLCTITLIYACSRNSKSIVTESIGLNNDNLKETVNEVTSIESSKSNVTASLEQNGTTVGKNDSQGGSTLVEFSNRFNCTQEKSENGSLVYTYSKDNIAVSIHRSEGNVFFLVNNSGREMQYLCEGIPSGAESKVEIFMSDLTEDGKEELVIKYPISIGIGCMSHFGLKVIDNDTLDELNVFSDNMYFTQEQVLVINAVANKWKEDDPKGFSWWNNLDEKSKRQVSGFIPTVERSADGDKIVVTCGAYGSHPSDPYNVFKVKLYYNNGKFDVDNVSCNSN